jgi:hypothetical protein
MFTLVVIVRLRSVLANLIFGLFKIFERLPGDKPNQETAQNDREERQAQPPDALKFVHGLHLSVSATPMRGPPSRLSVSHGRRPKSFS